MSDVSPATLIPRSPAFEAARANDDWLVGAVYFQPNDIDQDKLRFEFERMRELGFNAVRFYHAHPPEIEPGVFDFSRPDQWMQAADRAGIRVIQHLEWFWLSDALLEREGLDRATFEHCHGDDPRYRAAIEAHYRPMLERYRDHPAMYMWGVLGEPEVGPARLPKADRPRFGQWLEAKYASLEQLNEAWNLYPDRGQLIIESFSDAWQHLSGLYAEEKISGVHRAMVNYGAARDCIEYATDHSFSRAKPLLELIRSIDQEHGIAIGAHQLFASQPLLRWDIPRWAKLGDLFTTSIHLSWHFELVDGEVDRPVYLQARMTRDADKTGRTSCYETTAGPVQYSGGFGNAMSPGLMRRLMFSYLAAGNLDIAFWTWNPRPGGWEAGEYGMIDLAGDLTPWAQEAGRIAKAMDQYHKELAQSDDEAEVGIVTSWDTDAVLCLEPPRHDLAGYRDHSSGSPLQAVRARIGLGRALLNAHLPFHYVTTDELATPLAQRYTTLYAPHLRTLGETVLDQLIAYVENGGRLIVDVPFAFNDPWGKLLSTGQGSKIERLLGGWVSNIHDSRTQQRMLGQAELAGYFADIKVTDAKVQATFDDGKPAIIEKTFGRGPEAGSTVLIGADLSRQCLKPGDRNAEGLIASWVTAGQPPRYRCDAPLVWRRRCDAADHYFLLNDGPSMSAVLSVFDVSYSDVMDAVTGETFVSSRTLAVPLEAHSGRWIRCSRV